MCCCPEGLGHSGKVGCKRSGKVQQGEVPSLAPGEEEPQAPGHAGAAQLESGLAEMALGVLVATKLTMSQQRALVAH